MMMPSLADLHAAAASVHKVIPPTPQIRWPLLCERVGAEVWVKHENHTPLGAFKVRGGVLYIADLIQRHPTVTGVIAATRGNHGQSVAFAAARRAVELDDSESTCQAILGHVCLQQRHYDLAVRYTRRAVEINPNNQWNAADLGSCLVYAGEPEEALTWFSKAREIDPYFDVPWYWREAALACMNLRRYDDALSKLGQARGRQYRNAALAAGCHARLGDMERARAGVAACLSIRPDFSIAQFMCKEPFKNPDDAEHVAASLRLAGLPD